MTAPRTDECCPRFDPAAWDEKTVTWDDKPFVQDRVKCVFHIPLNFGAVMKRSMDKIVAADASPDEVIVLSDESSRWGSNVFIAVSKDVPDAKMTRISGAFLAKVFEGHYREMGTWVRDMKTWVSDQGKTLQKLYFYYTTCPKCAKQTGKNYVVLLGQV